MRFLNCLVTIFCLLGISGCAFPWQSALQGLDLKNATRKFKVISFEATDVVDPPNALLVESYSESGFIVETTNLNPSSSLSGILGLDTTSFPNPGIQTVNRPPGVRVALPEDPIDDIVITRVDGKKFRFLGGYFSFTNKLTRLSPATITFEGYKNGVLVNTASLEIVEQGSFLSVFMPKKFDTLIIKDNDSGGWTYMDNLLFSQ